ncbi:hypothetical protein C8Q76DRAFT_175687 [Earliella scabrosa]|nr:hypothetical protein C8Q76DRAFT_175687 [Earliella scabrosa]
MPRALSTTPDSDVIVDNSRRDLISYSPTEPIQWFFYEPYYKNVEGFFNATWVQSGIVRSYTSQESEYNATRSVYSINGTAMGDFKTFYAPRYIHAVQFWQSDPLPFGRHNLTVEIREGDYFALDWIEYNVTTQPELRPTSLSTSPSPSTPTSESTSAAPRQPALPSSNRIVNVGAAIGGAVAGVVVFLGAICAFVFWRRRRSRQLHMLNETEVARGRVDVVSPPSSTLPSETGVPSMGEKAVIYLSPS